MRIHLPNKIMLVPDLILPEEAGAQRDELQKWLSELCRSIEEYFRKAYFDISMGTSRFRITTSVPTTSTLEEGEIILYDNQVDTRRIYTKMNGVVRYATFT